MTEIDLTGFDIAGAERIGVPKGDDRVPCVDAFQEATGIEVPDFRGRELSAISEGREFFLLKGRDIAGFAAAGFIDLGTTGTDSYDCCEKSQDVRCRRIGDAMCQLVLMSLEDSEASVRERLEADARYASALMPVASPLPGYVDGFAASRDLPIKAVDLPAGVTVSGSMEIMPQVLKGMGVELVADRVDSGETARDNGLVPVMPMMDIYPALVQRMEAS